MRIPEVGTISSIANILLEEAKIIGAPPVNPQEPVHHVAGEEERCYEEASYHCYDGSLEGNMALILFEAVLHKVQLS